MHRCRVLLVEDDPDFAEYVRLLLIEEQTVRYQVDTKNRLAEALRILPQFAFDAVLVDLNLPDSRGLDTLVRLQSGLRDLPSNPAVVALTSLDLPELSVHAVKHGVQDYIFKSELSEGRLGRVLQHAVARQHILSEMEKEKNELAQAHQHDKLTGLKSRDFFEERAHAEIERAIEFNHPLCIAIFDLDRFKSINDTHGHLAGDVALQAFAEVVRDVTRTSDVPSRFGGDEFVLLMPYTNEAQAKTVADRILDASEGQPLEFDTGDVVVRASVGICQLSVEHSSLEALLKAADAALYRAKAGSHREITAGS